MAVPCSTPEAAQLDAAGYLVLPGVLSPARLEALRTRVAELFAEEGEAAGAEFRREPEAGRLANLVDKGALFLELILTPSVLPWVEQVLGPGFKLSSLNARVAQPFQTRGQPLHADMGSVPDAQGSWVCNTVWLLDDFTGENGALRVVPGSHRWGRLPQDVLADPIASHPDEVLLTGAAGSVFVMNAHTWHAGTANRTSVPRRAIHAFYCRRDMPQQQHQKRLLRPATQAMLSPSLRRLLALDDPDNDRITAEATVRSGFLK
ncbi:MAG: phytanoyl-CoA dioxygenase family protein [Armatimonadetes bacterium]|nr:phytanoyl-CoA dioxygenase family protein [Armatimonadota bacterium]